MGPSRRRVPGVAVCLGMALAGCGGGSSDSPVQPPPPSPDFSLSISTTTVSVSQGATAAPLSVSVTAIRGFAGSVQVTFAGLPTGVISDPSGPFNVAAGSSQAVVLGATAGATPGSFDVTVQGASAGLSHSASLQLAVTAKAPPPSLPRTTYARTDSLPASDDPPGEPHRRRIVYDKARQRVFVANRAMNRIEVFSSGDQTSLGQIAVPAPTSVDLSIDGKTLWIGSEVEQIVAADPETLTVQARYPVDGLTPVPTVPNMLFNLPTEVVALANGKLFVRLLRTDAAMSMLTLWDPATNAFTDLTPRAPALFQNGAGVIARSGDRTRVIVASNDSSATYAVFDASGNLVVQGNSLGAGTIPLLAANADGSLFAVFLSAGINSALYLLDGGLNLTGARGATAIHGMTFSPDGQRLYLSENDDLPPAISVLDASSLLLLGQVPDLRLNGLRSEIEDADDTGLLFGIVNRGVSFLDAATPGSLLDSPPVFSETPAAAPSEGPAGGGTTITLIGQNLRDGAQVTFGRNPASAVNVLGGTQVQATSPPSQTNASINLTAYFPNGWLALAPDGFSYGPRILETSPNALRSDGGDEIRILGYGFGSDAGKISVAIGGKAASIEQVEDLSGVAPSLGLDPTYPFPLEEITVRTPAGTAGKADLQVTSPAGSATASGAVQFLRNMQTFALPGPYGFIVYDQGRKRAYLSANGRLDVFDVSAGQFSTALAPAGGWPPVADLRGMALTADNSQLVVADFGGQNVYLLSPDAAGNENVVFVGGVPGFLNSGPVRVAATSTGKVFVGMSGESAGACSQCLGQLDLTTQPIQVQVASQPEISALTGTPLVQSAAQGNQVFLAFGASPGGPVAVWNASTNGFVSAVGSSSAADLATAANGTKFATISALGIPTPADVWDIDLKLALRAAVSEKQNIPGSVNVPGLTLHPSGALLYRPFQTGAPGNPGTRGGVDIVNAWTAALKLRVYLPEPFLTAADALHGSFLATDEWGQKIFALTQSGLTVVELASVPVGIGAASPASVPAAGGTVVTIRGSGFLSGARVTVGGTAASVNFIDADTLEVTTPAMSAGPQRIVVTNPDGESDALDAAFAAASTVN